jgi:regulator of sigma E protease
MGTITLSLALLNLLPLPALDGGRILFIIPELLFKKRVPPSFEYAVNFIGFSIMILLLIYINIQDFINPVTLP